MKTVSIVVAALAATLPAIALSASPQAPLIPMYDAAGVERVCEAGLAQARRSIDAMAARKGPAGILDEWNRLFIEIDDASNVPSFYATFHPDKDVRAASEACEQKFTSLNTELNQNEKIFARLKAFKPGNAKQAKLQRDLLNGFEDSGAALPPGKRARAKELLDQIEEQRVVFERNVRDDPTKVSFTAAEMEGLPEAYLKARKPDASGNYVLGLDQPSYSPFMQNARNEAARERYFRARNQQGGRGNLEVMQKMFTLRQELAGLHGLPTFAHYGVRHKMAARPENVARFLAEVKAAITPAQQRELEELRVAKAGERGTALEATRLNPWDTSYYTEMLQRSRFDIDQERLRAYFPSDKSLDFALLLAERLYGVRFREDKVPTWHPDVRYFEMFDGRSGRYMANLYVDLFPRDGKRPGAFAGAVRTPSKIAHRTPTAILVANFNRTGLNQRELETLLHELGHALNSTLSYADYAPQGLSTIKWDFVEAPSQMFEEWARSPQTLALFKEVCAQCPQLSADEIRRLEEARRFGEANGYAYQWLLASFDMEMSTRPRAPLEAWKELEAATPLGYVEGTTFPTGFRHLAGGYAAGYYGYMWSRVIARDLLTAFNGNLLDAKVGARYRDAILGAGAEIEEADMVRKFLGRETSSKPFFAEITGAAPAGALPPGLAPLGSGVDARSLDPKVRAQDDLFLHVNGKWLQSTEIPADRAQQGAFVKLAEDTNDQLRTLVEGLDGGKGGEAKKIVDLYGSFMDEARLESLGLKPLAQELARISALKSKDEIAALIAHFNRIGVSAPYDSAVHQDNRDSTKYIVDVFQGGLGLPDRDYYLKDDDAKLVEARARYRAHIEKMLGMAGERNAAAVAGGIMDLETRLARVQWTKVENRDPVKTYNRVELAGLAALAPGYAWPRYLRAAGIEGKVDSLIVSQPSYFTGLAKVVEEAPLAAWKQYFRWHLLKTFAPYLSKAFVDEGFAFSGTALRGIPENRPRWKRGIALVEQSTGEALGRLYVARHFPPERKARMDRLVANLLEAYRGSIDGLEWMGPATRKEAHAKLAAFIPKIGYPAKWRDYSALRIDRGDLIGNILRAQEFEYRRNVAKLGKPIDRDEWYMTPQRVNAYYNPEMNEIVFPAAILQPPFFNADADDAVNYGGIGAVIGHEISHGFDDSGSQYDGVGNLRVWWTPEDKERFDQRTKALVAQYAAYSPLPGYNLNGELTLGENIADNSGLAIAYKAYILSLGGKPAPVIDGLTGEQRFFLGWAQVWQEKTREAEEIRLVKIDPHSPARFRANGAVVNQSAFYDAFGVKAGDGMYLPPGQRVSIW